MAYSRWLAATLVVCLGASVCLSSARADQRTDARREYRAGMAAIVAGKYDEGIARLEIAYDILPHPNVLYNLGLAHMYAGRIYPALAYFERYMETAPPDEAAKVEAFINKLRGRPRVAVSAPLNTSKTTTDSETAPQLAPRASESEQSVARARQSEPSEPHGDDKRVAAEVDKLPVPARPPNVGLPKPQTLRGGYEEQVVSASRFAQSPLDAPNATAIITAQDIRMTGLTNITDLLRRVAGVEVNQVTPVHAEVSIRGLNRRQSNKVLFLVDGRTQRADWLGTSWWNTVPIPVEQIERIEIIRGPASALYGADAFSGVINIVTKRAEERDEAYASGQYGTDRTSRAAAGFSGKVGKLAHRHSVMYTATDNAVLIVDNNRVDARPRNNRFQRAMNAASATSELRYDFGKDTELVVGGSAFYGDSTIQGLSRLGQVTLPKSWRTSAYATLTTAIGLRLSTLYNWGAVPAGASFITPGAIDVLGDSHRTDMSENDLSWTLRFGGAVPQVITLGAGYAYKKIHWNWFDDDHSQHHFSGYLQDVLELTRVLKLQLGARVDHHPLLSDPQFSPRGSLVYRFVEDQSLRVSIGRAFRGPSFLESYLSVANPAPLRAVTGLGMGNDQLRPESIVSYELGYQNQESDYFALEANVYFNMVKDAILFTDVHRYTLADFAGQNERAQFMDDAAAFPVSSIGYTNERGTFRQLGGELGARLFPVAGLDVYANYSIHETAPMKRGQIDPIRAKERQTSLHKVNGGVQYRAPFGLDTSLDVSWFSDQLWVEQVTDSERGVKFESFDQPSFTMLSARIGYRLFSDRLQLGVVGTNLVDADKRQHPFGQPVDRRVFGSALVRL